MNFIDELLKDEKVEWKKLEKIKEIRILSPSKKIKKQEYLFSGKYPIIDQSQNFIVGYTDDETSIFPEDEYMIFGDHTEIIKYVDFKFSQGADGIKVMKTDDNYIKTKYLYHVILNYYKKTGKYMRHFSLLKNTEIPVPSLETQEKIVKILDNFTKYVTELQAELQERNKQYNYYRDMLLSEDYLNKISKKLDSLSVENQELRLTTLGEVGKVSMCRRILKNQTTSNGEVPFYKIGTFGKKADSFISKSLFEEYKSRYSFPKKGNILISASGTIGRTVIYNGEDAYFQDSNIVWIDNDETVVKNKYLYYFYSTNPWKISNGGTISRIYNKDIEKIKIFVPPIEIQNKIIKILDRFQELLSDTKGLLPLEIEQRRKQYEYYREKLLTFDSICDRTNERTNER